MTAAAGGKQSVRRALKLIFLLKGHAFSGLRLKQIAEAAEQAPSTTLRDLEVLADEGVVERLPGDTERWRLSPRLIQLALSHQHEVAALTQRLDDFTNRYSRSPT